MPTSRLSELKKVSYIHKRKVEKSHKIFNYGFNLLEFFCLLKFTFFVCFYSFFIQLKRVYFQFSSRLVYTDVLQIFIKFLHIQYWLKYLNFRVKKNSTFSWNLQSVKISEIFVNIFRFFKRFFHEFYKQKT